MSTETKYGLSWLSMLAGLGLLVLAAWMATRG